MITRTTCNNGWHDRHGRCAACNAAVVRQLIGTRTHCAVCGEALEDIGWHDEQGRCGRCEQGARSLRNQIIRTEEASRHPVIHDHSVDFTALLGIEAD